MKDSLLAAGSSHSAALRTDGTVLSAGANDYGQSEVAEWTEIVAISASPGHTVGLKQMELWLLQG